LFSVHQELSYKQFLPRKPILGDYAREDAGLAPFFAYFPSQLSQKLSQTKSLLPRPDKLEFLRHLTEVHTQLGAPKPALENLERLSRPEALVVMTGQQPGIATGPIYTIYKALSVIALARRWEKLYGLPVIPVFWVASEDHDLAEINQLTMITGENKLERLQMELPEHVGWAVGDIPAGCGQEEFWENLRRLLPETEFKTPLVTLLQRTWEESSSLGEWFARLLTVLMGRWGLVLMDAQDYALKRLLRPFWQKVLEDPLELRELVVQAGRDLTGAGYSPQLKPLPDTCPFFLFEGKVRSRVSFRDGYFHTAQNSYHAQEIGSLLDEAPERFSLGVVLRPIAADYIFPTLAHIGGPSELSYFAQLGPVYERLEVPKPLLWPRLSLTIIEANVLRTLQRYDLTPWQLVSSEAGNLANRIARKQHPDLDPQRWQSIRKKALEPLDQLEQSLTSSSMLQPVELARQKINFQLSYLEDKLVQLSRRQNQELLQRLTGAKQRLFPSGKSQERNLSVLYFLAKYGQNWLEDLHTNIDTLIGPEYGKHYFLSQQPPHK